MPKVSLLATEIKNGLYTSQPFGASCKQCRHLGFLAYGAKTNLT